MTSSSQSWKSVWARRQLDPSRGSTLAQLLAADGLDSPFSEVSEGAWRAFVTDLADTLGLGPGRSVYEVGCGAGALLYPLHEMGCVVGGLDQSGALIEAARSAMPDGQWTLGDAASLDPAEPWDVVVSMGVFLYFPDHDYARGVMARMAAKARTAVAILDVPDAEDRDEALAYRRGALGEAEYEEKYRGLDHLHYGRGWFLRQLTEIGATAIQIGDQRLAGYDNGRFRFNVIART